MPTLTPPAPPSMQRGSQGRAFVIAADLSTMLELPVTNWKFKYDGKNQMVGNNRDGRLRIPGTPDITDGTLTMFWDAANPQSLVTAGPAIRPNMIVNLQLNVDGTDVALQSWRFSAIIDDVNPTSEFDKTVDYAASFSLAGGGIKAPGDT